MTRQIIDIGAAANDGTGDTLRDAATKINENFLELYNSQHYSVDPALYTLDGTINFNFVTTMINPTAARAWTLPNGTYNGQIKKIVNVATNAAYTITLTVASLARRTTGTTQTSGPTIIINLETVATCEWYQGKWYIGFNMRGTTA